MKEITEEEFVAACKVIDAYNKQMKAKSLSIYENCTEKDLLIKEINNKEKKTVYFWVTKDKEIPDRNPDGSIIYDYMCEFYTLEYGRVPYDTYDKAYKNLIKGFKRKGFIK